MQSKVSSKSKSQSGAAVFLVMVAMSLVLGLIAMGYMLLIASQHRLVSQSMNWNTAVALAEAGIEEGLSQLNIVFGTNYSSSAATNWTYSSASQTYGPISRTMSNGSYSAIIQLNGGACPVIISTGYAAVSYNLPQARRIIKVTTTNSPAFPGALVVTGTIDLKGNNIEVDSYNSADPAHNTNGLYNAATRLAGGDIASTGGFISVQNADIYGHMLTGPAGSYSIGSQGHVGDLTWSTAGAIQPGYYRNDYNLDIRDVSPPYTSGLTLVKVSGTYTLTNGNYYTNGSLNGSFRVTGSNVQLYVTGNLSGDFTVNSNASIKVFVGTASPLPAVSLNLSYVDAPTASSFQLYGLPSLTTITWNGNNEYRGVVYAPEADVTGNGGGSSDLDFQGSIVAKSVTLNGHFSFHYDESLKAGGPPANFTVTSWREL